MEKNKVKKNISIIITVAVIILGLWFIIIYPLIRFNENEKIVSKAGKRYYEINSSRLPKEGEISTVSLRTLLDQKYIDDLRTAYNKDTCSGKESWVKVKKIKGEYKYYVYLKCGVMTSNIDHKGPTIKLKGKNTIEAEKDSKFTDPGIESVIDNTDGKMDIKDVYIKSDVDTSKIGEYTITYSINDSFDNETEIKRKVIVSQSLEKTVEKATDKDNIYKGNANNNYLKFSGQLFRIVGLNSDGTVKIVSNEDISHVDYNSVDKWLEEYYYNHLADTSKEYLEKNYDFCQNTVKKADVDKQNACENSKNKKNVGLLSINEYNSTSKEGESYLYTNTINWTSDSLDSKKAWTTRRNFFGQDSKYLEYDKNYNFNVRPVLIIKKGVKIVGGTGTVDDPYDIGDFTTAKGGVKTTTRYSGEYVTYGGIVYRIVDADIDGYTKVISVNDIFNQSIEYGTGKQYNPTKNGNIGHFIENNVSKNVKVGVFAKHEINVPIYKKQATYTGKKTTKKYNVKFAAPSMYEMYSTYFDSAWYIESTESDMKYLSSFNGTVYQSVYEIDLSAKARYTGYLKKSTVIVSGDGTYQNPYKISY